MVDPNLDLVLDPDLDRILRTGNLYIVFGSGVNLKIDSVLDLIQNKMYSGTIMWYMIKAK